MEDEDLASLGEGKRASGPGDGPSVGVAGMNKPALNSSPSSQACWPHKTTRDQVNRALGTMSDDQSLS